MFHIVSPFYLFFWKVSPLYIILHHEEKRTAATASGYLSQGKPLLEVVDRVQIWQVYCFSTNDTPSFLFM